MINDQSRDRPLLSRFYVKWVEHVITTEQYCKDGKKQEHSREMGHNLS